MAYINTLNVDGTSYNVTSLINKINIDGVTYDIGLDTSDATATAAQILSGKTAYVNGNKITGSLTDNSGVTITTTTRSVASGYLIMQPPGTSYVTTSTKLRCTQANIASTIGLTAAKIVSGNTILGVAGSAVKSCGANFTFQSGGYTENSGENRKLPDKTDVWGGASVSNTRYATLPAGTYYVVGCCGYLTGGQGQGGKVYIAKSGSLGTSICDAALTETSNGSGRATYGTFYTSFTLSASTTITIVLIQNAGAGFGSFGAVTVTKK